MLRPALGLGELGELPGGSHLVHDRLGDFVMPAREHVQDALEECDAFFAARRRVAAFRGLGRFDSPVDVSGRAQTDAACNLFGSRVDDVQRAWLDRVNPLTVDIELEHFAHAYSPRKVAAHDTAFGCP